MKMKKARSKFLSVFLVLSLVVACFGIQATAVSGNSYLFTDYCNGKSMAKNGWVNSNNAVNYKNGRIMSNYNNTALLKNRVDDPMSWSNYTYSATVNISNIKNGTNEQNVTDGTNNFNATLIFGYTVDDSGNYKQYEFRYLYSGTKQTGTVSLLKRSTESGAQTKDTATKTLNFEFNKDYVFTVVVSGGKADCYIDKELYCTMSLTDEEIVGTIGLVSDSQRVYFDDIKVMKNSSSEVSISYDFGQLDHTPNTGTKQMRALGFDTLGTTAPSYDFGKDSDAIRIKNPSAAAVLKNINGCFDWTNYTAETNFSISETKINGVTKLSKPTPYAGIEVAVNESGAGLEWTIANIDDATPTYQARLYDRANKVSIGTANILNVSFDKTINLKTVMINKTIYCYVNGVLYLTYTANETLKGTVGLYGGGTTTTYYDLSINASGNEKPIFDSNYTFTPSASSVKSSSVQEVSTGANNSLHIENGYLTAPAGGYAQTKTAYTDGYVEAKFALNSITTTKTTSYPISLMGRYVNSSNYVGVRIKVAISGTEDNKTYTPTLEWSRQDANAPSGYTNMTSKICDLTDFSFGMTEYTLRLEVLGDYCAVYLNNELKAERLINSNLASGKFRMEYYSNVAAGDVLVSQLKAVEKDSVKLTLNNDKLSVKKLNAFTKVGDTNSFYKTDYEPGVGITITVNPLNGEQLKAGSLKAVFNDGSFVNIVGRPGNYDEQVGLGEGNKFVLIAPSEDFELTAEFVSLEETDFNFATVASSTNESANKIRFLNRLYLPESASGEKLSTTVSFNGDEYEIVDYGSLVVPTVLLNTTSTNLDINAVSNPSVKAKKVSVLDNGFIYDKTNAYIDFTCMITEITADNFARNYSCCAYVELTPAGGGESTFVYSDLVTASVQSLFD